MINRNEENIDFSRKAKADANKYKLSVREKAFADLMAMGWKDFDAFLASGLYNPVYNKDTNMRDMNNLLMQDEAFDAYLSAMGKKARKTKKSTGNGKIEEEAEDNGINMAVELSKENQLRELLIAKAKQPIGSKEWLDIKKMIADITQAKKDEIQTEDTTIHYYLPLTCNVCELYQKHKKNMKH